MRKGFTLIELILVVAIVAILAGAMIPFITSAKEEARIASMLQMADTLALACRQFNSDTGRCPREQTTPNDHLWANVNSYPGWDGPYIQEPLLNLRNPYGGFIDVSSTINPIGSICNIAIIFHDVPRNVTQKADTMVDIGVVGYWGSTGKIGHEPIGALEFMDVRYIIGKATN
ncbi:MAG: prepilin-type N-terminal cleavage/methylation domain-containing protein [Nitrospirota bacterium]